MIKVSVALAAKLMNKGRSLYVYHCSGVWCRSGMPSGCQTLNSSRYAYYINPRQFCEYLGITEEELATAAKETP